MPHVFLLDVIAVAFPLDGPPVYWINFEKAPKTGLEIDLVKKTISPPETWLYQLPDGSRLHQIVQIIYDYGNMTVLIVLDNGATVLKTVQITRDTAVLIVTLNDSVRITVEED